MAEQWVGIVGQPEHIVSNLGRVRHRRVGASNLKGYVDADGYRRVRIGNIERRVHRLVCEAFHGPCPSGKQCAHLDGNPLNNVAVNLAWQTPSENSAAKVQHGTHQAGEKHPRAKLTARDVDAIRQSPLSSRVLATQFGVGQSQIVRIKNGSRWAEGIAQDQWHDH